MALTEIEVRTAKPRQSVDTKVAAVFIQAYTFGKVVEDMSEPPLISDDWADWIMSILDHKILA